MVGEAFQHDLERAAGFAGAQQADVEAAENSALGFHRVGKRRPFLHPLTDRAEHLGQRLLVGQRYEYRQRPIERQPGLQQRGQLARDVTDVLLGNALAAPLEVELAATFDGGGFVHADRDVTERLQLLDHVRA